MVINTCFLSNFRTPTNLQYSLLLPLPAPLGQVLSLLNETLVNWTGQKSDALLGTGIGEVLTGHANGTAS